LTGLYGLYSFRRAVGFALFERAPSPQSIAMKFAALVLFVLAACARPAYRDADMGRSSEPPPADDTPLANEPVSEPSSPSASTESEPSPPAGPAELEVPGFGAAIVILPTAKARPAPVLVAAHGAGDSPEWQCEHWGAVARGRYYVLCPRGLSLGGGGYYYANHIELGKELVAAIAAVRKTHGSIARPDGGIYTGYSQGATMGALMIIDHGKEFPHLVLVEGGTSEWSLGRAKRFAATGGKSVALVCGGSGCMRRAEAAAKVLERAGLRARAEHAQGGGHTYVGIVGERATELLENWLLREP
jgi:predicted esterase